MPGKLMELLKSRRWSLRMHKIKMAQTRQSLLQGNSMRTGYIHGRINFIPFFAGEDWRRWRLSRGHKSCPICVMLLLKYYLVHSELSCHMNPYNNATFQTCLSQTRWSPAMSLLSLAQEYWVDAYVEVRYVVDNGSATPSPSCAWRNTRLWGKLQPRVLENLPAIWQI